MSRGSGPANLSTPNPSSGLPFASVRGARTPEYLAHDSMTPTMFLVVVVVVVEATEMLAALA